MEQVMASAVWEEGEALSPSAGAGIDEECRPGDESADSIYPVQEQRQIMQDWTDGQPNQDVEDREAASRERQQQDKVLEALEAREQELRVSKQLREHALREAQLEEQESQLRQQLLKYDEELFKMAKQEEEMLVSQNNLNEVNIQLREYEHASKRVTQKIDEYERELKAVEAEVRNRHAADNNRIKKELSAVLESRREVLAELKIVSKERALLANREAMLVSDIESRYREHTELVAQQEELDRFVK